MKIFKRLLILSIILGFLFLHFYVPRVITEIRNPLIEKLRSNQVRKSSSFREHLDLKGKFINFKSFDNIELSSYLTYSDLEKTEGTIILVHGIRSNKEHFIDISSYLASLGYNSVALDLRAHGDSQGNHCTFGVKEKRDISTLIDVLEKENTNSNVGIWGQSLGGAIALQAMGSDPRINFGIIESTFSDFNTIVNDYFKLHLGFNFKPLSNYLINRAGKIANFDPQDAKPIKYCKNINQPILLIHGKLDKRISIDYARDNYDNIPSKSKEFLEIENANHLNVWRKGGPVLFEKIEDYLKKNTLNR